jgi:hypothetical protein
MIDEFKINYITCCARKYQSWHVSRMHAAPL